MILGKRKTVLQAVSLVVFMGGLAWASVPFYDWFCRVTGYGGTTTTAAAPSERILDRTIKVRFDASVDRDMPWSFR
ncbi:MAG: cytochrome c oxidase assembly protein, partial [Proteobacteria bacterium]|nr:cytochrome c oxidase assembly protein [Pseudomonadota bacterium]